MPYEEMKAPAKKKDNKPKKPERIEESEMKKAKRKSAIKFEE
jgi:hypothetical protein